MKQTLTIFVLLLLCVGCQPSQYSSEEQSPLPANTFQPARLYNNGLPADGCDYRIALQIDTTWVEYAPDEKSRKLVETFATSTLDFSGDYHGYKDVQVKGYLTKKQKAVVCGWGGSKELAEISISDIKK